MADGEGNDHVEQVLEEKKDESGGQETPMVETKPDEISGEGKEQPEGEAGDNAGM